MHYAKFEVQQGNVPGARHVYERAVEAHFAAQSTQAQEVQQQQELGVRRLRGGDALRPDGRRSWLLVAGGRDSKRRVVSQPFLASHYYSHRS